MKTSIRRALNALGCDEKQQRFYIANFELGSANVSDIAKRARLQRSTAYIIADDLVHNGLITEDSRARGKLFTACTPAQLMRMLDSHHRKIGKINLFFKENLEEIEAQYSSHNVLPKVKTYHGQTGLMSVLRDILKSKTEILLWTNQLTEESVFTHELHENFIKQRVELGIGTRVLAINNSAGLKLFSDDSSKLRETKLLPGNMNFSAETYLYDNKLALLDFSGDVIGIVIESDSVHNAQKAIFENTWNTLQNE